MTRRLRIADCGLRIADSELLTPSAIFDFPNKVDTHVRTYDNNPHSPFRIPHSLDARLLNLLVGVV